MYKRDETSEALFAVRREWLGQEHSPLVFMRFGNKRFFTMFYLRVTRLKPGMEERCSTLKVSLLFGKWTDRCQPGSY